MFYAQRDYLEMKKLCTEMDLPESQEILENELQELTKEYLYAVLRNYQRKEKELIQQRLRQGQKFSKLFQRTVKKRRATLFFKWEY